MDAGRELDALVAEKVMAFHVEQRPRHSGAHAGDLLPWCSVEGVPGDPFPLLPYSTDIGAAWLVVEKLMPRIFRVQYQPADSFYDGEGDTAVRAHWVAYFEDGAEVEAKTAPLAVCLAALAALGVDLSARAPGARKSTP